MIRTRLFFLMISMIIQSMLYAGSGSQTFAQEWRVRGKPLGTLKVVDLAYSWWSPPLLYSDSLVALDKDKNWVPQLAEDWRWIDERTIEFKLRHGVKFQNGEDFNAHAVMLNWEA